MIFIEVGDHVVGLIVNQSFAHFGLNDKRKLLSDIVRGTGKRFPLLLQNRYVF